MREIDERWWLGTVWLLAALLVAVALRIALKGG